MQRSLFALVLAAIVLVVYAPIVVGGHTWDDARYHTEIAPPRIAAADSVLHGELPTWWDGTALGVPLLAEPSHGAAYPPQWIAATPHSLDLFLILHLLWCALGVVVWSRRRGASELGALVAGAMLATSGVMASAALRGALPALAHLPWLAVTARTLSDARDPRFKTRYAIATAALLALIGLSGEILVLAYAIVVIALNLRSRIWQLACVIPGLAIACVLWLPAIAIAGDVVGAAREPAALARIVELVIPLRTDAALPPLYVGIPLVALAVLGRPTLRVALAMAALLVLAFVLGPGELQIAAFAILAATQAAAGFDRVVQWLPRKLVVVGLAIAPTAFALPLLFHTVERSLVDTPPAWQRAIDRVDVWPRRVFRPVMTYGRTTGEADATLENRIDTLGGTSAAKWGTGSARSEDPARSRVHDRVWAAASGMGGSLLDRYSIRFAILPASTVGDSGGPAFHELHRAGEWALSEYRASPAAAVIYEWLFVGDRDTALARLFPPGAKRGLDSGIVVLEGKGIANQDEPGPAQPCTMERWSGAAIDVRCTAESAAYHVVSSSAARGWSVTLDGNETPWLVADVIRRAIALTPGEHRIAWRYWPPGLTAGLVLAALGIAGLLALWLGYGRHSHARDRTPDPERADTN